ncbi:MAG: hypothetical protein RR690_02265, partial [Longicatena sp.]
MVKLEIKKLYEIVEQEEKEGRMGDKTYWNDLWKDYIEEKSGDYRMLDVKEAMSRFVSEQNLRLRRNVNNCGELGVD